jgi:CTP:molybdopterin cytidylyltransferase MocA
MSSAKIAAIILSAGASARMGAFKPLLELGGKPLLVHVIETAHRAGVGDVLVVTGHRAEALAPAATAAGAAAIFNSEYETGMFSSVCAGIRHLDSTVDAFYLLPVDIPLVRPSSFRRLAAAWVQEPGRVFYPVFAGKRGHPPLVPAALIPAILQHPGHGGLQKVLEDYEDRAQDVAVADENILFDVDRPEDYQSAKDRFADLAVPSPAECEAILSDVHPVDERVVRHSRKVQAAAQALCRAVNGAGADIDESRVAAAALLHDVAKGLPDHAAEGGRMIAALGFEKVAAIAAAHNDLPEEEIAEPKEAALVYLADKLVMEDRFVSLEARFDNAFKRFGSDAAARAAVERRRRTAFYVRRKVEERTGLTLEEILLEFGIRYDSRQ